MLDLFEGPEKKLEILLHRPDPTLRDGPDGRWAGVVQASGAAIISRISDEHLDAYLLSESSLFVWDDRILMITCGETTLIDAVPAILRLVAPDNVAMAFYERRRLMLPQAQPKAADFEAEVMRLSRWFGGRSYRLGPANRDHVHVFLAGQAPVHLGRETTVELLMTGLAPERAALFYTRHARSPATRAILTRLKRLFPGMRMDSHFFEPHGYSLNAIRTGTYCTVHVTPQPEGSYASFETNLRRADLGNLVYGLIDIFLPERFCLVDTNSLDLRPVSQPDRFGLPFQGYKVTEEGCHKFDCGYAIRFLNLIRASSLGAHPVQRLI